MTCIQFLQRLDEIFLKLDKWKAHSENPSARKQYSYLSEFKEENRAFFRETLAFEGT